MLTRPARRVEAGPYAGFRLRAQGAPAGLRAWGGVSRQHLTLSPSHSGVRAAGPLSSEWVRKAAAAVLG